jgi:hypothetical protein
LDEVTATTDIPQHESDDVGLLGVGLHAFQSIFVVCEIKRIVHALD